MTTPFPGRGVNSNPPRHFEVWSRQAEDDGWQREEGEAAPGH